MWQTQRTLEPAEWAGSQAVGNAEWLFCFVGPFKLGRRDYFGVCGYFAARKAEHFPFVLEFTVTRQQEGEAVWLRTRKLSLQCVWGGGGEGREGSSTMGAVFSFEGCCEGQGSRGTRGLIPPAASKVHLETMTNVKGNL